MYEICFIGQQLNLSLEHSDLVFRTYEDEPCTAGSLSVSLGSLGTRSRSCRRIHRSRMFKFSSPRDVQGLWMSEQELIAVTRHQLVTVRDARKISKTNVPNSEIHDQLHAQRVYV